MIDFGALRCFLETLDRKKKIKNFYQNQNFNRLAMILIIFPSIQKFFFAQSFGITESCGAVLLYILMS